MKKRTIFYKKLMISYNIVIFSFILIINLVAFKAIQKKDIEYNRQINKRIITNTYNVFRDIENFISVFMHELYADSSILNDTIYFLNNSLNDYLKNKLDKFYESEDNYYKGIEYLITTNLNRNSLIQSIEVVSYKNKMSYLFTRPDKMEIKQLYTSDNSKNILQSTNHQGEEIIYIKNINNPLNLKKEGLIAFKIDKSKIDDIIENNKQNFRLLVLKQNGLIVYDSDCKENTYFEEIANVLNTNNKNIETLTLQDETVIVSIAKDKFLTTYKNSIWYIIIANILLLFGSECLIFKRLKKLNNRLNVILDTLETVNIDNKLKRIPQYVQTEKDEISIICKKFNKMCDDLETYINRYYVSKINQKNAEMKNLQNNINPHFLYNTLESIRMKAIINNDKEVAKMIYMLAHVFRSQLKEKDVITIKSELEYCYKFLEIYKFRYANKIAYNVYCEEDLLKQKIIKFLLQPLIENYFIHGIRLEDNDNTINIKIYRLYDKIKIEIEDNGKGIEKQKLCTLKQKIKNEQNDDQMVGILNVNQRIKMKYGSEYGLYIQSQEHKGTKINIDLPYNKKEVD